MRPAHRKVAKIKLIGIDVDGTLLDSRGQLPADNLSAIVEAANRGIHIAIVTGRSFFFAMPAVAALPDPLTLVVHNGAIARTRAGDTLMRRLMPRQLALDVLGATASWRDAAVVIFDRPLAGQMVYDRLDWEHPNRSRFRDRNREIIEQVASLEEAITEDPIQVAYNGSVPAMRDVMAALERHPAADALSVSLTEYPSRDFSLVDVSAAGTTKGTGLAAVASLLGVDRAHVMAVGDNYNDREMLEWAAVGVVMGNAAPDLLTTGLETTASNDEAGLAAAIRRFAL
ncbi:MAG TPA: HAD family hydrolase [Vicinamibacterales bacterium]|nr:HAD family hydrolase [Vicinamibacterales bacterium]